MADVKSPTSASKDALAAIFGKGSQKAQVGSEPPSGAQGPGTIAQPYDQGNAPEQVPTEPQSGAQGKGTVDEPHDQGNAPEHAPNAAATNNTTTQSSETHQGSGMPMQEPNAEQTSAIKKSKSHLESVMGNQSGKSTNTDPEPTPTPQSTEKPVEEKPVEEKTESRGRKEWPNTRGGQTERSVSPGTLDDGSHATTSGDRGEGYNPQSKLGKLKGKVFGH